MRASAKTQRLTGLALFTGIIVVLQIVCTFVKFGPFTLTLAMVPIVVGAAVYGPKAGAYLGGVFGLVVVVASVTGADPGGYTFFTARPFVTIVLIMVKGIMAGLAAGAVYAALRRKSTMAGVIVAAVVSPVVNTGIFVAGVLLLYRDLLMAMAGGTSVLFFALTVLIGVNFLVELAVDVVLIPVVARIIQAAGSVRAKKTA